MMNHKTKTAEMDALRPRSWSRSTERASAVLACFSLDTPRLRVAQLAKRLDLHPSSVYRYLEALQGAHLVERDEQYGDYKLGLRIVELSAVVLRDLEVRRHALDEMDALRDELGLMVNLAVLLDADVVHVAHAFPPGWPRENMVVGRPAVSQATALGKVLLAYLPWEDALGRVLAAGWRPCTENTIREDAMLKAELQDVAKRGFAVEREERSVGIMCVAVPIRSANEAVCAALSVTGRVEQVCAKGPETLASRLMLAARRISTRLGSTHDMHEYL